LGSARVREISAFRFRSPALITSVQVLVLVSAPDFPRSRSRSVLKILRVPFHWCSQRKILRVPCFKRQIAFRSRSRFFQFGVLKNRTRMFQFGPFQGAYSDEQDQRPPRACVLAVHPLHSLPIFSPTRAGYHTGGAAIHIGNSTGTRNNPPVSMRRCWTVPRATT
jgi:hypothetical protein